MSPNRFIAATVFAAGLIAMQVRPSLAQGAPALYSLMVAAQRDEIDPRVWVEDVIRLIAPCAAARLNHLMPWNRGSGSRSAAV